VLREHACQGSTLPPHGECVCTVGRLRQQPSATGVHLQVQRDGREAWVTLLDEVVGCLQRRAESLSLDATPQPYKVRICAAAFGRACLGR
jgi:hypothetical protein